MHAVLAVRHEDEMEGMLPIGLPSTSMRTSPTRPPSGAALYDHTAPQRATIPTRPIAKENEPVRTISNVQYGRAYLRQVLLHPRFDKVLTLGTSQFVSI